MRYWDKLGKNKPIDDDDRRKLVMEKLRNDCSELSFDPETVCQSCSSFGLFKLISAYSSIAIFPSHLLIEMNEKIDFFNAAQGSN